MENLQAQVLIAQGGAPAPAAGNEGGNPWGMLPFFVGFIILFYLFFMRPQSKERARRTSMLSELKKNDKVVTIGGIIGTVFSVNAESDEVVLKVDESTNTKLRVLRSSVHQVITDETEGEKSSK